MTSGPDATASRCIHVFLLFLLGTAAFAGACALAPLYYSNQNQYFLHGLANAGVGLLREDWLANTRDPTPVFSALVTVTVRFLHPFAFYLIYSLLLGAYAAAMLGLFLFLVDRSVAIRRWPVFLALFVAFHSALGRWGSYHLCGEDYPWFFQAGVAGQYVLGGYLQPSVFGVLLVVAIVLFVRGWILWAGVCVAVSATFHPSYLLPAALLTLGFLAALAAERRFRQAATLSVLTLVLVAPVTAHILLVFGPTSADAFSQSQDVLVNMRIPHHSRPDRWLDVVAGLQIGWVLFALALVRRTRLFLVLAAPFVLSAALTFIQWATGSDTLALLFPWRVSAVLVPVATTIILSRLVTRPGLKLDGPAVRLASAALVVGLAIAGVWMSVGGLAFQSGHEEVRVIEFVSRMKKPGDVYFVPVSLSVKATRGSLSTDFQPLSFKRRDKRGIPIDLQRFRLTAGAPILVDFKAIPYKDVEVLEWRDRIRVTQTVQQLLGKGWFSQLQALAILRSRGVTHLVLPADAGEMGWGLEQVYTDEYYRVYRLTSATQG